ncbi:alpha-1,4-digalacturonate transport system permease protein [Clostridium saccharoperbutylacetonicum]|jgi:alpha-1,4-digalacturonate transport system permease protein|uniref:L-arabinose transport system permease protein AraQ n=1 Tax=Clostridium saccharoperbutylacetonicum N1-4(HMT) TaxID=931276 RepID=M1MDJ4_9CLOT|nr:carbohydrate ABC transporter permease [Clostridium saccharoperbutylacetonicum]AGF55994.1 L-arabinose transport system permease protein AraQ [Clostridium saccharoperbutylacetonicum N1-4(HMT)]NRT63267.1 alpha-1,4-digalacturonate transport system permease protein [Clostridium saccharoperbutylacetonicum]NSB26629.1 alpha-1,4-digalacturonate transport system permease protein [Clostridium saccharoperbutylacetonicum]NSB45979.1 alpha-1,4-digalacturonate transport system permease protein [Clostridium 
MKNKSQGASVLYDKTSSSLLTVGLWIVAFLYLFPLLWFILSSFKPGSELFSYPLTLLPKSPTFDNYVNSWSTLDFFTYILNTSKAAIITTILTVLASASCGYAFAKYDRKWLKFFFMCVIATTMLPTEVIMNPTFSVIKMLGLYDSSAGIIIPSINTATGIFMFRTFFVSVPDDLIESARIDGASEGKIFFRIMLPLAKPVIMALSIFSFQWRWNDYIWPLIVLNDPKKYTLQVAIRSLVGAENINWSLLIGASVISLIPLLLVFIVFQRYILDSNVTSGLKD